MHFNVTVENETVANGEVAAPQKQKFENLDDVLNLKNYDKLEQTEAETCKYSDAKGTFITDWHILSYIKILQVKEQLGTLERLKKEQKIKQEL